MYTAQIDPHPGEPSVSDEWQRLGHAHTGQLCLIESSATTLVILCCEFLMWIHPGRISRWDLQFVMHIIILWLEI